MTDAGIVLFDKGVEVTPRSLSLHGLSYPEWEEGYKKFVYVDNCCQFWIGDFLLAGQRTFGEEFSQALDEEHEQTHKKYMFVCSRIPKERRRESLSYSIHKEVCSIEDVATQEKILSVAERDGLTVREVRLLVKAARGEATKLVDWFGKFEKLIKDMWGSVDEDEFKRTTDKMRSYLEFAYAP